MLSGALLLRMWNITTPIAPTASITEDVLLRTAHTGRKMVKLSNLGKFPDLQIITFEKEVKKKMRIEKMCICDILHWRSVKQQGESLQ